MKLVSIIIPAKDEEETIGRVLDDLNNTLNKIMDHTFEVIVVDNNSKDNTSKIAKEKKAKVFFEERLGKGRALLNGFNKSKGDYIIMLDADYSHRPEDIPRFLKKLEEGAGLVIGSRFYGGSDEYNVIRSFGNVSLTFIFRIMFGQHLTDVLNGFKAFKRDIYTNFNYSSKNFEIEIELVSNTLKQGYKIVEVPSHERERAGGKMKSFAPIHGTKFLLKIIEEGIKYRKYKLSHKKI